MQHKGRGRGVKTVVRPVYLTKQDLDKLYDNQPPAMREALIETNHRLMDRYKPCPRTARPEYIDRKWKDKPLHEVE